MPLTYLTRRQRVLAHLRRTKPAIGLGLVLGLFALMGAMLGATL